MLNVKGMRFPIDVIPVCIAALRRNAAERSGVQLLWSVSKWAKSPHFDAGAHTGTKFLFRIVRTDDAARRRKADHLLVISITPSVRSSSGRYRVIVTTE